MITPFNVVLHGFLLAEGFEHTRVDGSVEDLGSAESGPDIHETFPYDEYGYRDGHIYQVVRVDRDGHVGADVEDAEFYCCEMSS